ncbi:MAG TPA: hypothetical protein VEH50_03490 [Methylomirabilota bacterium]|nr:hypothetical protein [Methylomirabilota bacterium]
MKRAGTYRAAKLAEVSVGTADRALHGHPGISEITRKEVFGIATQPADTGSYCDRIFRSFEE